MLTVKGHGPTLRTPVLASIPLVKHGIRKIREARFEHGGLRPAYAGHCTARPGTTQPDDDAERTRFSIAKSTHVTDQVTPIPDDLPKNYLFIFS